MKKTEATPSDTTPDLEALLQRDLNAWILAKEAIEQARSKSHSRG